MAVAHYHEIRPIITRAEAMAAGANKYFTGKPCKRGHVCERYVVSWVCQECLALRSREWAKANPDERKNVYRAYRSANAEKLAAQKKAWKNDNRDKHKASCERHRIKRYMPLDAFGEMLEKQGGRCAICKTDKGYSGGGDGRRLAIDHCHSTGVVRGLLCGNCNRMLGLVKDDPETLRIAALYLESVK